MAAALETRWAIGRGWSAQTTYLVERDMMLSAYALRKLHDAHKLSTSFPKHQLRVLEYPLSGTEMPSVWDRWSPERFYDLEHGKRRTLALSKVLNLIIHSRILLFVSDGIVVNSDKTSASLFLVLIEEWLNALRRYGTEDIVIAETYFARSSRPEKRVSQHDLVDRGVARYVDSERGEIEYVAPLKADETALMLLGAAYPQDPEDWSKLRR